jgi:hypothetical protein
MIALTYACVCAACATTEEPDTDPSPPTGNALTAANSCHDAGTPAPPEPSCLFGEQFHDIRTNPALQLASDIWIRSVAGLTALERQQILVAVQQSSHDDVTTPEQALERVDQMEIRFIAIHQLATDRNFVVYEYGAGDNSYGAFFPSDSAEVLASIHDGDLLNCQTPAASD